MSDLFDKLVSKIVPPGSGVDDLGCSIVIYFFVIGVMVAIVMTILIFLLFRFLPEIV